MDISFFLIGWFCLFSPVLGVKLYDVVDQCCNGTVHARVWESENVYSSCCGNGIYMVGKEICCDGKVKKLPTEADPGTQEHYQCCNGDIYRDDQRHCCSGQIEDLPPEAKGRKRKCCGRKLAVEGKHICCNNKIYETNGRPLYCCGSEPYNESEKLCCTFYNGDRSRKTKLINKPKPETACCGNGQIFDVKTRVCCNNTVVNFTSASLFDYDCCGDGLIEASDDEKMCCGDRIVRVAASERNKYRCCSTSVYDENDQCCHRDKVVQKATQNTMCCRGEMYEPSTPSVCCGKRLVPIVDPGKRECCFAYRN